MRIRVRFEKMGNMRFIGHLDILRYFQKAFQRADIPVKYSEGFHPHPRCRDGCTRRRHGCGYNTLARPTP